MVTNYDKIKNQNRIEMSRSLAEIWLAAMICDKNAFIPKAKQITEAVDYFYTWLGEDTYE